MSKQKGTCPGCNREVYYREDPTCIDCQGSSFVVRFDDSFEGRGRLYGPFETEAEAEAWIGRCVPECLIGTYRIEEINTRWNQ